MSQRQKHTANINQIDINLTMLHWTYGASDMYDTFYAITICTIWIMISMDGGFDNSNWSFHDKRCHTSWIGNVTCPFFDGPSDSIYLFFWNCTFQWYLYCYKILCSLYCQWYHNVIKTDDTKINWIWISITIPLITVGFIIWQIISNHWRTYNTISYR